MFGLGPTELLIVGVVAVLLFGSRLPSVARSAGRSLTEFKRGMQDMRDEFERASHEDQNPYRSSAVAEPRAVESAAPTGDMVTDGAATTKPVASTPAE